MNVVELVKKRNISKEEDLSIYASKSIDKIRFKEEDEDIRTPYFRDIDRVIYSLSYTRYIDKTQVFSNTSNDNISKRMIHVQLVSKIARSIGRALNLNEDLIEAIALGHDIGHVPFGHAGEEILSKISVKEGVGYFNHNIQSVRTFMYIENNGLGSNLCLQTLDGIMCHCGEFVNNIYKPVSKTKETFFEEYNKSFNVKGICKTFSSMTLEGCLVRICDIVGYVGRDIDDAIRLGKFDRKKLPSDIVDILGDNTKSIINTIELDIIKESMDKPYIKMSKPVYNALKNLKKFNYDNIYSKSLTDEKFRECEMMFNKLYYNILENINKKNMEHDIFTVFLNRMSNNYINTTEDKVKALDYIAGMTDGYFINQYNKYCI